MDKDLKNSTSAAALSVLTELKQRLDAITPDQYFTPGRAFEQGDHVVGPMTDTIRRSFTLYKLLHDESVATQRELRELERQTQLALDDTTGIGFLLKLKRILGDDTAEKIEGLRLKANDLALMCKQAQIAFQADTQREYPKLVGKYSFAIDCDSNVSWQDAPKPQIEFIGDQPPPEIAAMLEEILGSRFGRR